MTDPVEALATNPVDRAPIPVRRPRIELGTRPAADAHAVSLTPMGPREIPRHWWGGDPFRTHVMDAFSSTLPFGEAFFVRAVRHYASQIDDPLLQDEIARFAAQEGQHSRLHDEHVQLLLDQGYTALESQNRIFDRVMRWHNRKTPAFSLAVTTSLEHLTSILARQILEDRFGWLEDMDPEMAKLWRWHALEEAEHKSVAFDVSMQVAPSRWLRCSAMALNTVGLSFEIFARMVYMLWKDGLLLRGPGRAGGTRWLDGWRFLFGRRGFLRGTGREYLAWYRADFHPNQNDDRPLIDRYAPGIAAEVLR